MSPSSDRAAAPMASESVDPSSAAAAPAAPSRDVRWSATPLAEGSTQVRVRYEETDRAGVGYHANTFVWFECARTELLRSLGLPYRELEEAGWLLTVTDVAATYRRSVLYDEVLTVRCAIVSVGGARMRIEYVITGPDGVLRTTGHTVLGCLDTTSGRPRRLPPHVLARLVGAPDASPDGEEGSA